jgi:hypothetical protein
MEFNPARSGSTKVAVGDCDMAFPKELIGESNIHLSNVESARHHSGSAIDLCKKTVPNRAIQIEFLQQHSQGIIPITRVLLIVFIEREQEVIHPADTSDRIIDAGRDTRSEQGAEHIARIPGGQTVAAVQQYLLKLCTVHVSHPPIVLITTHPGQVLLR